VVEAEAEEAAVEVVAVAVAQVVLGKCIPQSMPLQSPCS